MQFKQNCSDCPNRQLLPLTYSDFYNHLEGKKEDGSDVIDLYVLKEDNTCHLLCADFDDKNCELGFQDDVLAYVGVCKSWENRETRRNPQTDGLKSHYIILYR